MSRPLHQQPEFWTTVASVLVLTVGHYAAPTQSPFWHDLFRRLYYLPIILAGFRYGLRGGLVAAGFISVFFLPHVLMTRAVLERQASEAVFEIPLFLLVGAVTGLLSDRQRLADASLRRAERLKTLGQMAAGMAHEVKNPLAAVRSAAQMLDSRVEGRDADLTRIILSEVDRLNRVVNDFLNYARPAPLRRGPLHLSRVVGTCVELLSSQMAGQGREVSRSWPEDEARVQGDANLLRQVFLNLLLNATQAAHRSIVITGEQTGREVRVRVTDDGPGIPPDKLKHVFEPFYTTRPGGTGLGLAIARRIVAEHGGRIELVSEPDKGTTATVVLPRNGV